MDSMGWLGIVVEKKKTIQSHTVLESVYTMRKTQTLIVDKQLLFHSQRCMSHETILMSVFTNVYIFKIQYMIVET